jgi:Zn-dependent peptidase ImmA (M78 family)
LNLKISGDSLDHDEIAETLLDEAGVLDLLPTDELRVLDYLGLRQLSFDFCDEPDFVRHAPDIPAHLRAALSVNDRVVVTHSELGAKRHRWSVFHEIAHFVMPEHIEKVFLDTDKTLNPWTKIRLEREANSLAAELMFQGNRFTERSLDLPLSCSTVLELAPQFDASYESAMRRYVERHVLPCAVIVYDKVPGALGEDVEDAKYRIHYTVTSSPFRRKYFAGVQTTSELARGSDIFQVYGTWNIGNVVATELVVNRNEEAPWRFQTEIFTNGYKIFQFIVRPSQ